MTKRFQQAYDALINAFFEGTLAKGTCLACACGTIVSNAAGIKVTEEMIQDKCSFTSLGRNDLSWQHVRIPRFINSKILYVPIPHDSPFYTDSVRKISDNVKELTGYNTEELTQIENAFEYNTKIGFSSYPYTSIQDVLEDQYNGLVAVFEVLCKLDNISDVDYKSKLKEKEELVLA